jgi:hypothetical protein
LSRSQVRSSSHQRRIAMDIGKENCREISTGLPMARAADATPDGH